MPTDPQSELLNELVTQKYPIAETVWGDFWDRLRAKELGAGEALAVVCTLTARLPDGASIGAMLRSLRERNPQPDPPPQPTVNIVGTGGGPSTFNLSTASAFVAAACGARVIKTGSRAYASRTGSVDLLERLGVPMTSSYEQTEEMLEAFSIACAGPFVYPKELRLLARQILPYGMKTVGRFFNVVGPFLAAVPVTTQITGVSDHSVLPTFYELVEQDSSKRLWICSNALGADELLSIVDSQVYDSQDGKVFTLSPTELGLSGGTFDELLPVDDIDRTVDHFLGLIGGHGPTVAIESIQLNAGALVLHAGVAADWAEAIELAATTMNNGEPAALIERLRNSAKPSTGVAPGAKSDG